MSSIRLHPLRCLAQHRSQDRLDLLELLLAGDQRRRELHDRVAAVVGAADQPAAVQLAREKAAQQVLGLLGLERLLGLLVLHQLDRLEVPRSTHVADDRQVAQPIEHLAEPALVGAHVRAQLLALHHVDVREPHRARHRMPAEGEAVGEVSVPCRNGSAMRSAAITAPRGAYAEVRPFAIVIMSGW